jgi:predicted TIM-barrel fold metal-dependent hydrolase
MSEDSTRPHSPYLIQRDTLDNGFSKGWIPHFLPSEEYWIDMHVHMSGVTNADDLKRLLDEWFSRLDAYRLGKIVVIVDQDKLFDVFDEFSRKDSRFAWMYWPKIDAPSVEQVRDAVSHGACALKLHNSPIMGGRMPRNVYQSEEWQAILSYAETAEIPLLWHVTQRYGYSPYHGGGLNAYWQDGWAKGVDFTNEDLLQDVLAQMRQHPKLKVIGAHQLHVGVDRLSVLFKEYKNLYIDSSCGMYLRWTDEFIEADRLLLCEFVETWSERIVFGTDAGLFPGGIDEYAIQGFLCHPRFMLKLGLNDKALQDVAWRTAQQLFNLKSVSSARRGNIRP